MTGTGQNHVSNILKLFYSTINKRKRQETFSDTFYYKEKSNYLN